MAVQDILQLGNPYLRERSVSITNVDAPEVQRAITDLGDTLADFQQRNGFGRAISAVQIGIPYRLIYMRIDKPVVLVNPVIADFSDEKMILWDDCFSFPNLMVKVQRHLRIDVRYTNEQGIQTELRAEGSLSELLQHEIDHLDGMLAVDRAIDKDSFCLRQEWEKRYKTNLPLIKTNQA
ncbi:MAG TPA: peptide deformylase [Blastocatellia bacterium]|nr:peptide deformylase [Blastocatellia bacterium]